MTITDRDRRILASLPTPPSRRMAEDHDEIVELLRLSDLGLVGHDPFRTAYWRTEAGSKAIGEEPKP